jgi:uncharacterized protein YacL
MDEAFPKLTNIIITLSISMIIASFVGYILVPIFLKKLGVNKRARIAISKVCMAILLIVVFSNAFQGSP